MKESVKQVLKVTLDINRTLHRTAIRWDNEQLCFPNDTRENNIVFRGRRIAWYVNQKLLKVLGYHGFVIDGVRYYRCEQDPAVFFIMTSIYWMFTRFSALLTGAKIPLLKPYDPDPTWIYWAL